WRLSRDVAVVRRDGLRLLLSVLLRLQSRPVDDEWLLGGDAAARQGPQPVSSRVSTVRRRRRNSRRGLSALSRAGGIFLRPLPAHRPALRRPAGLYDRGHPASRRPEPGGASRAVLPIRVEIPDAGARDG